uniref:Tiorf165 protein n=1 Tax=Agrobacterium tumefaciens TaxID=358 RepID=Q9R6B1_AGRTU|nr:tiorf165 [Agrobacterium tumefaciens]
MHPEDRARGLRRAFRLHRFCLPSHPAQAYHRGDQLSPRVAINLFRQEIRRPRSGRQTRKIQEACLRMVGEQERPGLSKEERAFYAHAADYGIFAQLILDQCRQSIMTFTEVDRLGRDHDPYAVRRKDHAGTAQARAIAAMRAADAPSSRRMVTAPTMISGRLVLLISGSATGGSMTTAANSTGSSGAGRTSLPCRAIVRQVERRFARNP